MVVAQKTATLPVPEWKYDIATPVVRKFLYQPHLVDDDQKPNIYAVSTFLEKLGDDADRWRHVVLDLVEGLLYFHSVGTAITIVIGGGGGGCCCVGKIRIGRRWWALEVLPEGLTAADNPAYFGGNDAAVAGPHMGDLLPRATADITEETV